jgi:hypothetical protein
VKECEERESQTQKTISVLEQELKQLHSARGGLNPASQAVASTIEALLAVDQHNQQHMLLQHEIHSDEFDDMLG